MLYTHAQGKFANPFLDKKKQNYLTSDCLTMVVSDVCVCRKQYDTYRTLTMSQKAAS